MQLLSTNAKSEKSEGLGFKNLILQMLPHKNNSMNKNLCPAANGCEKTCLVYSGRGLFPVVKEARMKRTELFVTNKHEFLRKLDLEITRLKKRNKLALRLNGFTDIQWENIKINSKNIFELHPDVQFYDYTKIGRRMSLEIPNYHLTFSGSNNNWLECENLLTNGKNVALVFEKNLPEVFNSFIVIDATGHDLRFLDGQYVISGLTYKSVKNGGNNKALIKESTLVYSYD